MLVIVTLLLAGIYGCKQAEMEIGPSAEQLQAAADSTENVISAQRSAHTADSLRTIAIRDSTEKAELAAKRKNAKPARPYVSRWAQNYDREGKLIESTSYPGR